jgi:plastocyanin
LKKTLLGVVFCGLLTVLITACGVANATPNAGPTVHMGATDFLQHSVTIQKGDMLNLVDDTSSKHIVTNGTWENGEAKPAKEPGAPTVNQTFNGNDSATIGPFNTAGTYHLYCTIHQNMNLTIIVH